MADNTLLDSRPPWVRALKRIVLRFVVPQAAGYLVPGSLARAHVEHYGAHPSRVVTFPLTIDVAGFARRVEAARARRDETRAALGVPQGATAVLHVGRLIAQKGVDVLLRAGAKAGGGDMHVIVAGDGPDEAALRALATDCGVSATFAGMLDADRLADVYAAADVFALASRRETWGVVVNEAAAAGLPLVLSDRVGAAADLLEPGGNGELVPTEDESALAAALERLEADPELRRRYGSRSRELVGPWGYEPSVAALAQLIGEVTRR